MGFYLRRYEEKSKDDRPVSHNNKHNNNSFNPLTSLRTDRGKRSRPFTLGTTVTTLRSCSLVLEPGTSLTMKSLSTSHHSLEDDLDMCKIRSENVTILDVDVQSNDLDVCFAGSFNVECDSEEGECQPQSTRDFSPIVSVGQESRMTIHLKPSSRLEFILVPFYDVEDDDDLDEEEEEAEAFECPYNRESLVAEKWIDL